MRKPPLLGATLALSVTAAALGYASAAKAQWGMMPGYGMMRGYGMGPGMMYGYGPGMMGPGYGMMYGYGPGMMGPGWQGQQANLNLGTTDVKTYLERWIAVEGNPRLKVGDVKEKDANTIEADIVTKEGNVLVQRFIVDRHTGFYRPSAS
jgi:hypothetical protein